jgi:hypothetical protein
MSDFHVIPFGKHKGKPVEVLAGDPSYKEWLIGQGWFQERHPNLYTIIVNNYGEPTETPEHNNLQGRFLDEGFCLRFLDVYSPGWGRADLLKEWVQCVDGIEKVRSHWRWRHQAASFNTLEVYDVAWVENFIRDGLAFEKLPITRKITRREFEYSSVNRRGVIDVILNGTASIYDLDMRASIGVAIELKPSVGDDYPAVLRQMRTNGAECLFLKDYCGVGVTRTQFVEIFKSAGIRVVFVEEVDPLPPVVPYRYE